MTDTADGTATDVAASDTSASEHRIPWVFAIWLIVAGIVGEIAAFALTYEKFDAYLHPGTPAACDISPLVQCTANLDSWQGSLFGFPNPIIGLIGWMAPIVVGVSLLAGARFPRWYWIAFNVGVLGALALVIFLISQSIYAPNLGTLCPWCMTTWAVTIPTFFALTFRNLATGVFGDRPRRVGRALLSWVVPVTLIAFVVIIVLAQLELNALVRIFG